MSAEYAVYGETPSGKIIVIHRGFNSVEDAEDYPVILAAWKRVWVGKVDREPKWEEGQH